MGSEKRAGRIIGVLIIVLLLSRHCLVGWVILAGRAQPVARIVPPRGATVKMPALD